MKYLTKEWYLSRKSEIEDLVRYPSEEARFFSEDYFQKLFAESEQAHLNSAKEDFRDMVQQDAQDHHESSPSAFDCEQAKAEHHDLFLSRIEFLKQELPTDIIESIADLRICALRYATPEVIEMIHEYCEAFKKVWHETLMASWAQQKLRFKDHEPAFLEDCSIHDYHIKTGRFVGDAFILEPAEDESTTFYEKLFGRKVYGATYIFRNAEILHLENSLEDTFGVYEEVFPSDSGYEFHFILAESPHGRQNAFEFDIRCSDLLILKPDQPTHETVQYRVLIETIIPGWKTNHVLKEYLDVETYLSPSIWVQINGRFPKIRSVTTPEGDPQFITSNDAGIIVQYTFTNLKEQA